MTSNDLVLTLGHLFFIGALLAREWPVEARVDATASVVGFVR
ncbi:hypothetical protein [Arthrobacter psychrochitiniphilus]|nr:hypothetical protein [Arthrobacter psychrochitiniphilus]NYG16047.1 hypothetical protein [Arthrobacter psychrochitiniphilus]